MKLFNAIASAAVSFLNQHDAQKKVAQARKDLSRFIQRIANDDFVVEKINKIVASTYQGDVHERFINPMPAFDHTEWFANREQKKWIQFNSEHYCQSRFAYREQSQLIKSRMKINESEFMWLIKRLEGGWMKR